MHRRSNPVPSGFRLDVSINSLCLTAPILLDAALVALIWTYGVNVEQNSLDADFPIVNPEVNGGAYYVNIHSTLLIFVASWMSSLAPFLVGYAIALATYPVARAMLRDTQHGCYSELPPPYQYSLAVKIISGSVWSSLWSLLLYNKSWKQRVSRHATMLTSLALVAVITILLSAVVFAADTWLHIATTPKNIQIGTLMSTDKAMYGLALQDSCALTNNSFAALTAMNTSCTISTSFNTAALVDGYAALQVLNNQSADLSVFPTITESGSQLDCLKVAASAINPNYDFTVETFGVLISCIPVTQACHLELGDNSTFSCNNKTFYEHGDALTGNALYPKAFRYPDYEDGGDDATVWGVDNPLYYAAAFATRAMSRLDSEIFEDPEVITKDGLSLGIIVSCNLTVLNITYDLVQGYAKNFKLEPSGVPITNALTSASFPSMGFGLPNMISSMNMAIMVAKSAQEIADQFASLLATTMLSGASGSVVRTPSKAAQLRTGLLVTRVPKAPLFLLLSVNLCFPIMSAILTLLALGTTPEERQARRRMSIHGLVAHIFDRRYAKLPVGSVEELYEEFHEKDRAVRVGLRSTRSGGCKLQSFRELHSPQGESSTGHCLVQQSDAGTSDN